MGGFQVKNLFIHVGKKRIRYWTRDAAGKYVNLGFSREAAETALRKMQEPRAPATIADMCREFLADPDTARKLSPRTLKSYAYNLNHYVLPVFGAMRPQDFRPMHKAQYLKVGRDKDRPVQANKDMTALQSAFNWGMTAGLVESNPCRGVPRNTEVPRSRSVQPAEANALFELARTRGHSVYMAALIAATVALTGRRRAEILRLPLSAATEAGIACRDAKTLDRDYLIEWSPMLQQVVAEARAIPRRVTRIGERYLFPNHDGQPYSDSGFCTNWQRLMKAYVSAGGMRFHAHDLRSLYVTKTLAAGRDPETHANKATMERVYNRRKAIKVRPIA